MPSCASCKSPFTIFSHHGRSKRHWYLSRLLAVYMLFSPLLLLAQPDSLIRLPEPMGVKTLLSIFENYRFPHLADSGTKLLQQLSETYDLQGKPMLQQHAWMYATSLQAEMLEDLDATIALLKNQSEWASKYGWPGIAAQLQFYAGYSYFARGKKGPGFEYMLRAYNKMEQMDSTQVPLLYHYAHHLASAYYNLGDFENFIRFATTYEKTDFRWLPEPDRYGFRNSMGMAYLQLKKYDSADAFFKKSHLSARLGGDSAWMALADGNLGYSYYLQNRLGEALPLLQTDFRTSLQHNLKESAVNAGLTVTRIYLRQQELVPAQQMMDIIDTLMPVVRSVETRKQYFELKFHLAQKQQRWQQAAAMADSALKYHAAANNNQNEAITTRVRNKLETENYLNSIASLQAQRNTEVMLRNALLGLVAMGALLLLLFINRYRIKKQKEADAAYYARQIAEDKLQLMKSELDQYTLRMKDKAAITQKLQDEIDALKLQHHQASAEKENVLQQLLQASILTEEDWDTFKSLFEKVHPGFLVRLRQTFPDLTPAETRLLVLTKLQLSNKEMTSMLGIGYDAIKKTRQRLRKKIDLPEEGGLDDLIQLI